MGSPSTIAERCDAPPASPIPPPVEQLRSIPLTELLALRDSAEFRGMFGFARTACVRRGEVTVDQLSDEIEARAGFGPLAGTDR